MNKIGLIISREYVTRVRKKSFIIMSLLGPLLIVGFILLTAFLTKSDKENYEILVVDESHLFDSILRNSPRYHLQWAPKDKSYQVEQSEIPSRGSPLTARFQFWGKTGPTHRLGFTDSLGIGR